MSSVLNSVNPVKTLGILLVSKMTCRPQNAKETEIYVYQYNTENIMVRTNSKLRNGLIY